ncbi:hypothetical protein [Roseimicrobium sp. ORNL1]|uniref:hypothetical protein n=1 Tax=Roseimicrobium sp. ORNL1 TaxID=2711231 RepID=UPI0013E1CB6F|nr:hypothetical protein [Roseimicrobium sp. ORNL1]QIF02741.1 hypothetical protein G5S37_14825 [Roseimicrobium sp. ORNL1]
MRIGLVAEGKTDHPVLENILKGFFRDKTNELTVTYRRPLTDQSSANYEAEKWGGWNQIFAYLRDGVFEGDLAYLDYIVIHVDSDRCEDAGFDVARRENGVELDVPTLIRRIIRRLRKETSCELLCEYGKKLIFAIPVDEIECWLLPLWESAKGKQRVRTKCAAKVRQAQRLKNEKLWIDKDSKAFSNHVDRYKHASKEFRTPARLSFAATEQVSLQYFLDQLSTLELS